LKLCINDTKLEIQLNDTNFVDYYVNRLFHTSVQKELTSLNLYQDYQTWNLRRNDLLDLLVATNKIVDQGLVDEGWRFDVPDTVEGVDVKYLGYVHEHWADYTDRFKKIQARGNTQDPFEKQMVVMDKRLRQEGFRSFAQINHCVHLIEHMHLQMYSIFKINQMNSKHDYQVQAEDTTFYPSQLNIPYHDIGRPQYEKWLLSGSVTNTEIENFTNISNQIELSMINNRLVNCHPEQEYIDACNRAEVDIWGNYLPLGNFKENYFYSGYKIFNALFDDEKNNKIYVEK